MTVLTENRHAVAFILSEGPGQISRDAILIAASQTIEPGQLLAALAIVAGTDAVPTVGATNTGNSTIAMGTPAVTSKVKNGRYKGIAVTATTVRWEDPEGQEIGTSTHGAAMTKGGIKVQITAGGTANVAGDEFYVDVSIESDDVEYVAFDPEGTDGSEVPSAIACYPAVTGASESVKITGFTRSGEVNGKELVLPVGITAAQTAKAFSALKEKHIVIRN